MVDLEDRTEAQAGARHRRRCRLHEGGEFQGVAARSLPEAEADGWTVLVRIKQTGFAREEAATLQDEFFAGESLGRMMITPLRGGAVFFLLYLAWREKEVPLIVIPELPAAAIPMPANIAAPATEAVLPPAVQQIAPAETIVLPDPELPLLQTF